MGSVVELSPNLPDLSQDQVVPPRPSFGMGKCLVVPLPPGLPSSTPNVTTTGDSFLDSLGRGFVHPS
jgi:hypothetical protein